MKPQFVDILAPAGSRAMMEAAVFAGANSVYIGVTGFNARRTAANFEVDELPEAVAFCHARGVKVNVALNTVLYDDELPDLAEVVRAVAKSGADAAIVQDLAVTRLVRQIAPGLALHASTQMSVTDLAGAKALAAQGFSRVILARELTADEIREITEHCGIETEIFVHGAHCMCVSGQCYMSAFYGGRSGNRGACAGPCRLPYTAGGKTDALLGLKDLSLMDHLPEIRDMGVACVKIEGRLRTPEYVAAAVDSARRALANEPYDRAMLEKAFSRSGFTAGFYENHYLTGEMFGHRTEEDGSTTKAALPALRELYRRERQSVPVKLALEMLPDRLALTVSDDIRSLTLSCPVVYEEAKNDITPALQRSLAKTGGTPFFAEEITCKTLPGQFCPLSAVNELRRDALAALLEQRSAVTPQEVRDIAPEPIARAMPRIPKLRARFASVRQLTAEAASMLSAWTLLLREAGQVPEEYRAKTVLALPRALFDDKMVAAALETAWRFGFRRFEAQSICGVGLIRQTLPEAEISGGFGLNITNTLSAKEYAGQRLASLTLSPELTLAQANAISAEVPLGLIVYGHMPVMLVRACPMRNVMDCAVCKQQGSLADRKGMVLTVECSGSGPAGAREIYNPVPLWLGDRMQEVGTDFATLYFTRESAQEVQQVLKAFMQNEPCEGNFTRGLYYKGVS
ncbi:MAG: DUF3656 domain-containing protein [Pygmaiobacter massiliensis]|nr:DUF3656 domain-containing protein [Pygmaiobacter massiliensis]